MLGGGGGSCEGDFCGMRSSCCRTKKTIPVTRGFTCTEANKKAHKCRLILGLSDLQVIEHVFKFVKRVKRNLFYNNLYS